MQYYKGPKLISGSTSCIKCKIKVGFASNILILEDPCRNQVEPHIASCAPEPVVGVLMHIFALWLFGSPSDLSYVVLEDPDSSSSLYYRYQ